MRGVVEDFPKPLARVLLEKDVEEAVCAVVRNVFLERGVGEGEEAAEVEFGEGDGGVVEVDAEPEGRAGVGDAVDVGEEEVWGGVGGGG